MSRIHTLAACVLLLAARSAFAQENPDTLPVGAKVQIHGVTATANGDRSYYYKGLVVGADSGHLMVRSASGGGVDTLPYFAMSNVQVSRGIVPRARLQTAAFLTGAAMGTGAVVLVTILSSVDGASTWSPFKKPAQFSIPAFAILGFVIGTVSDTEMWVTVRVPHQFRR